MPFILTEFLEESRFTYTTAAKYHTKLLAITRIDVLKVCKILITAFLK